MALSAALKGPWNPLRVDGTSMPANLLFLCKVLAVAILATGHYRILPEPFLPFLPFLDAVDADLFRHTLRTTCVVAAVALIFNRLPRLSATVLGSCLLLGVVASKAYYGNNKTFVGLCLVLAGLSDCDRPPYLLRWQFSLVYFGAALNKLLDPDWHSGVFFDYWAIAKVRNPVYIELAGLLPPLVLGKILCWGTIAAEFAVAFGLLVPRLVTLALWTNILFQVGLLEFTGDTFTLFFYAMNAAGLAFITWPESIHWTWRADVAGARPCPRITIAGETWEGFAAVRRIVFYQPWLWLLLTAFLAWCAQLPTGAALARRLLVAAVVIFFLPLWEWIALRSTKEPTSDRLLEG